MQDARCKMQDARGCPAPNRCWPAQLAQLAPREAQPRPNASATPEPAPLSRGRRAGGRREACRWFAPGLLNRWIRCRGVGGLQPPRLGVRPDLSGRDRDPPVAPAPPRPRARRPPGGHGARAPHPRGPAGQPPPPLLRSFPIAPGRTGGVATASHGRGLVKVGGVKREKICGRGLLVWVWAGP